MRVAGKIKYKNLENSNLECNIISKISIMVISKKKNDGNLEFNLEKDNLKNMVGNLFETRSEPVTYAKYIMPETHS